MTKFGRQQDDKLVFGFTHPNGPTVPDRGPVLATVRGCHGAPALRAHGGGGHSGVHRRGGQSTCRIASTPPLQIEVER